MNALLGRKLSIVTRKPQTTRHRVLGIHSEKAHQVIFLDTPGVLEPQYQLHEAMMQSTRRAIGEADLLLFLTEAGEEAPDPFSLKHLRDKPALLVLTKMDLIAQEEALPLVKAYTEEHAFEAVVPTSAKRGTNLETLMEEIITRLPEGPPFYPKDQVSEQPERFFVAEIIREKVFQRYHQEIPYSVQVDITAMRAREHEKLLIDAEILVNKESHKGILIGKGGKALKSVGIAARKDIESFLGEPVYLQLHVKTREGWRDRPGSLRAHGYER